MSRSSSKAINTDTSYDDEFDDESSGEDDQLAFISRKIGTHGRKGVDQTVGWSTMSKVCRGMAMCNMKAMNKACLMKLGWQLRTKGSGLWCQVMNGKYIRNVFMDSLMVKNYDFDLWKALANLWSDLECRPWGSPGLSAPLSLF